ncbi:MAG: response regulator transcription factor [Eubacteriales bacterium]
MRLLLCEDEKDLSAALVVMLKHNHYSVDAVYDGKEALDYLETENYDGVILDIMMPELDGISVLKKIRDKGNMVPVILLTAKSDVADKVTGLDLGANDYLTKPFESQELMARIRAMTRSREDSGTSLLEFGNITLNRATFQLSSPLSSVKLANKEFQMMEMLLLNSNLLISSEKFMEKIWGFDSETELNVVWVYISYLRKKLLSLQANIQIKASRNIGYSLEEISHG